MAKVESEAAWEAVWDALAAWDRISRAANRGRATAAAEETAREAFVQAQVRARRAEAAEAAAAGDTAKQARAEAQARKLEAGIKGRKHGEGRKRGG